MTNLNELASRVEAATGPDREIDCLIREAFDRRFQPQHRVMYYGKPTGEHIDVLDGDRFVKSPDYTASLDAAMTLVPEGFEWGVGSWGNPDTDGPWAWCDTKQNSRDNNLNYGKAATPALALVAAALRARAAGEE